MGGSNQGTCPPTTPTKSSRKNKPSKTPTGAVNPVRFHEVTSRGEVDFHDDNAGLKCSVDSAAFFSAYNAWRPQIWAAMDELTLAGNDGSGGHSSVTFLPYVDDAGDLQVEMTVSEAKMGRTVLDLDKLAHFS